jgi:methylmalonyl-CoA mutase
MPSPTVDLAPWRAATKLDDAALAKLREPTRDGFPIEPLYVVEPPEAEELRPFARRTTDARQLVAPLCFVDRPGADERIYEHATGGATGLWLRGKKLAGALAKVDPRALTLILQVDDASAALESLPEGTPAWLTWFWGAKPGDLAAQVREAGARKGVRAALVGALPEHAAGATPVQELAWLLASTAEALRELDGAGIAARVAAPQFGWQLGVGRHTFIEIAKLRAARILFAKLFAACGVSRADGLDPWIHAITSPLTQTQRDPHVNVLRGTTQAFAALVGGADAVTVLPWDLALGAPDAHAERVARNTALVLMEESHIGAVVDPAGGSYALESLTLELARGAWELFRATEREGGLRSILLDQRAMPPIDLGAAWSALAKDVRRRRLPVLGVSHFPTDDARLPREPLPQPLGGNREAQELEGLRDRADAIPAERRRVRLVRLGPLAEHALRDAFVRGFFAVAGLDADDAYEGATIACVLGADTRYATEAEAAVRAAKAGGASRVLLAGKPDPAIEPALRLAGLDDLVVAGVDVLPTLDGLLRALESPR